MFRPKNNLQWSLIHQKSNFIKDLPDFKTISFQFNFGDSNLVINSFQSNNLNGLSTATLVRPKHI
jgi:hypothetical protein